MKQIPGVTKLLILILLVVSRPEFLPADENPVLIKGVYSSDNRSFEGTATYRISSNKSGELLFHLPPNWYSPSDYRTKYYISDLKGEKKLFERLEIESVNDYVHENIHLAGKIIVQKVIINNKSVLFEVKDNLFGLPPKNSRETLLEVKTNHDNQSIENQRELIISIQFITSFRKIPKDYKTILIDFVPRPVVFNNDQYDLADHFHLNRFYKTELDIKKGNDVNEIIRIQQDSFSSIPIILASDWNGIYDKFNVSFDKYFSEKSDFINARIVRVLKFLDQYGWIKADQSKFNFVLWDGPLQSSGNYILIPRKIFSYRKEYYKTFELQLIRGIIASRIRKQFSINSNRYPWIIPALQSEIIRDFINKVYGGESSFFSWGSWLNPDLYQENTLRRWISAKKSQAILDARLPADVARISKDYHPWFEKGFHLIRTVLDPEKIETVYNPVVKKLLNQGESSARLLDEEAFYSLFLFSDEEKQFAGEWLSTKGSVDYAFESVEEQYKNNQHLMTVSIVNHGSISPAFTLRIKQKNGEIKNHIIRSGAGLFEFVSDSPFDEVMIDPEHHLLEDELLNNSWMIPLKIRPVWDFPTPEKWIIAVSPMIWGNSFDENLYGLSFNISYLDIAGVYIDAWKGENEEKILWETTFYLKNTPWRGSEIYYKSSELNASYSKIMGFEQEFLDYHEKTYLDLQLVDEKLKSLNDQDVSSDMNVWNNIGLTLSIPFYIGNYSEYWFDFSYRFGLNQKDEDLEYYQYSLNQSSVWYLWKTKLSLLFKGAYSYGIVPFQKRYPIGGPEGISGFPRENELLFDQRRIMETGFTFPPILTHTNLNLFNLGWLRRVESELYAHWGYAKQNDEFDWKEFKDIELRFVFFVEWLNMYQGNGIVTIAQPIDHDKYKDYRIVLFSNWVF
ncbi:hypothetical protein KJ966_10475 [bacterium]|nr:hypothetical protein [bacterium]